MKVGFSRERRSPHAHERGLSRAASADAVMQVIARLLPALWPWVRRCRGGVQANRRLLAASSAFACSRYRAIAFSADVIVAVRPSNSIRVPSRS